MSSALVIKDSSISKMSFDGDLRKLRLRPTQDAWWAPMEKVATEVAKETRDSLILDTIRDRKILTHRTAPVQDGLTGSVKDAILPAGGQIAYRRQLTLAPQSRIARYDTDHDAFGYVADFDPLLDKIVRTEIAFSGEASAWCCGSGTTTVDFALRQFEVNTKWYSIGFTIKRCELWKQKYDLIDTVAVKSALCKEILDLARCSVAFNGDDIQKVKGLRQMPCNRMSFPKPITEMTYTEIYNLFNLLVNANTIKVGERAIRPTHVLVPARLGVIWAMKNYDSPGGACCSGFLIDELMAAFNIKILETDWMDTAGRDGGAAMLFYHRAGQYINNLVAFAPTMLPPRDNCEGDLTFQWVMKRGDLENTDAASALMVEGLLPKAC